MGDRGNIVIQEAPGKRVYFYTHWRGSEIKEIAKTALARNQRWNDAGYLARIVFCTMINQDDEYHTPLLDETGFSISTDLGDNQHPILVIDVEHQTVWYENEDGTPYLEIQPYTFKEFIA